MSVEKIVLKPNDVVSMDEEENCTKDKTSIVQDMILAVKDAFADYSEINFERWIGGGIPCEVLQAQGGGWQTGTIKLSFCFEFIPDKPKVISEPPTPLDDFRSDLNI
ncbi:MAG: KGK domain-containing protein [Nostoc sp. ZfuVER08]|nr:KGK domain-containing protein [Nostoc sp. ZfuVER08]